MDTQESLRFDRAWPVERLTSLSERRGTPSRVGRDARIDRRQLPCTALLLVPAP